MSTRVRRKRRRPDMRRAVILFPSGLTLGNLFFGVFAIVAASRLEFVAAGVYVLLGGICDALDGRVARATNAGTEFGEELDSLVDAITFGLAPGMIMYFAVLNRSGWDWIWVFLFSACAVLRLARFNIEQAGTAKTYFQGLPSPAAGITLASYYWFSQSSLYTYGAIADLKWHVMLRYLMVVLSFLMISNVPYPVFPRTGFRSLRAIGATLLLIGSVVLLASGRLEYFFPFALVYVAWGLLRWVFSGLFERRQPTIPYDLSEGEDDEDDEEEEFELTDSRVHATRWSHRERAAHTEHLEPAERSGRAEREERSDRHRPRAERTSQRGQVADRPAERTSERKERPDRAERTAEKGGRTREEERSRREARQKERAPRERPVREPRTDTAKVPVAESAVASGVDAITLGAATDGGSAAATVAALHEPTAPSAPSGEAPEATTAPRKRKRRRRRSDRKDRATGGDATPNGSDTGPGGDEGAGDDGGDESPYVRSEPSSPHTAIVPATGSTLLPPPPAEAPRPAAETPPLLPPPPSDSSE